MDEIDKLLSPSQWARMPPEQVIKHHFNFIESESKSLIENIESKVNIAYGSTNRQKIDVIGTDLPDDAPILIFIHGGFFCLAEIRRSSYYFLAKNFHSNGIKTIFIGYDLCPEFSIRQITQQIGLAAQKCLQYAQKNNFRALYLMGHSAGAHLVTFFLNSLSPEQQGFVQEAFLISGVFDLSLLPKSTLNKCLKLDEKTALEMSPLHLELPNYPRFYVIVGEIETPEFIKQSKQFYEKLQKCDFKSEFYVIKKVDHFNILENLIDSKFELFQLIVKTIK